MRKKLIVPLFLGAIFSFHSSYAMDCVKFELPNRECSEIQNHDITIDLDQCNDELVSISKLRCRDSKLFVNIRGSQASYRIGLQRQDGGAWGTPGGWEKVSEVKIPLGVPASKSLPKTEHERTQTPKAT